jgi:hypothetical protein
MSDFTYGKAYSRRQWDGKGTRFRTDGTLVQMEVQFPLNVKERPAQELADVISDKASFLIDATSTIETISVAGQNDETYLVISGWIQGINRHEQDLAAELEYH